MEGCGNRVSCRNLFKKLKILPLTSQYLLSLLMFIVQNSNLFSTNTQVNLIIYQKGAYYSGIKICNNLPMEIEIVADNLKKFKVALKQFLYTYSFYSIINNISYHKNCLLHWH